ncbi:32953_t:CDS:2, partial [Racocetra persica]
MGIIDIRARKVDRFLLTEEVEYDEDADQEFVDDVWPLRTPKKRNVTCSRLNMSSLTPLPSTITPNENQINETIISNKKIQ